MTGGDLVVRCLAAQRVRHLFGIPGALNAALYDALARQDAIEHLLVRHELGAAWMADGYARASGEVGVCVTVPGPGATHAASGIAGAYTDCVPVLLLASRPETRHTIRWIIPAPGCPLGTPGYSKNVMSAPGSPCSSP